MSSEAIGQRFESELLEGKSDGHGGGVVIVSEMASGHVEFAAGV